MNNFELSNFLPENYIENQENKNESDKTHLRNVFSFHQVIHIKQHLDRNPELKEVIDDPLNPVLGLHLIRGEGPLLLAQGGGATFEYDLLYHPDIQNSVQN